MSLQTPPLFKDRCVLLLDDNVGEAGEDGKEDPADEDLSSSVYGSVYGPASDLSASIGSSR